MSLRLLFAFLVSLALGVAAAEAVEMQVQLDNNLFGNLNQNDVAACKDAQGNSFSCGAVATANSLAFLQRQYPGIYGNNLIPDTNGNNRIDYQELVDTATNIA